VRRAVLVIALLAVTAGNCGASTGRASSPGLGAGFSTKVVALCTHALAQKKAEPPFPFSSFNPTRPDRTKLPAIGRHELRGVQIFRTWYRAMVALGSPPQGRTQWKALLEALHDHVTIIVDQQAAATRSDAVTFTRDYYAGNNAQAAMTRAAKAAGVTICATAAGA
jgi:hypothetical protein